MSYRYPHPSNEKQFEQFCLKLLIRHWSNPDLELYGKRGERQFGVDIIDLGCSYPFKGAQCKHHDPEKTLPPAEIREEVEKAKGFDPPLDYYAILTTARVTTLAHNEVIKINKEHTAAGLFKVELFSWEKIERLLDQYPEIKDELLTVSNSQLVTIDQKLSVIQAQTATSGETSTTIIDMEIDEAQGYLDSHDRQSARLHLQRIKRRKWDSLTPQQKYRVEAVLANVLLGEGKQAEAARLLLEAKQIQPDTEKALVNEIIAYELLGEKAKAYSLAVELLKTYPTSAKVTACLLRNAAPTATLDELEPQVCLSASLDPEVCVALTMKAIEQRLFDRAEAFAHRGIAAKPEWNAPYLLLGQACLVSELSKPDRGYWVHRPRVDTSKIEQAVVAFDRAIQLGNDQRIPHETVGPLLGRAVSKALLGDEEGADQDFTEAARLAPDHPGVIFRYATHLHDRGDLGGAIKALKRVIALKAGIEMDYFLATALKERQDPGDRREATDLFVKIALVKTLSPDMSLNNLTLARLGLLLQEAFHGAIDGLAEGTRLEDIGQFLAKLSDGPFSIVALATARSKLALAQGDRAKALEGADEAIAKVDGNASHTDLRALAIQCTKLERHKDALPLWERLSTPGEMSGDVYHLIKCADRVNRHEIILRVCKMLRESGIDDPWILHQELNVLEAYDIDEAVTVLQHHLASHPTDQVSRTRLSRIGLRLERPDLIDATPGAIPDVENATPTAGAIAVDVLRKCGKPTEAMQYAYELFRRNPDDPVANQALFMSVLAPNSTQPTIQQPVAIEAGCAVCYSEERCPDAWIIVEDSPDPNRAFGEYPPDDPLVQELRGKRVGDHFVLGKSSARDRTAVIKEILSKYVYRMRYIADSWQVRFRDKPWIQVFRTRREDPATGRAEIDLTDLKLVADLHLEQRNSAEDVYKSNVIPIHVFAYLLGCTDYDASIVAALLAGLEVRCCDGTLDERNQAIAFLEPSPSIILDLTAIATLSLFREEKLLEHWKGKLIISQGTAIELRSLLEDVTYDDRARGRFGKTESAYHFIPVNAEATRQEQEGLKSWVELVLQRCDIRGCQELASVVPEKREELTNVLGQHGVESMVLAAQPGHVLWTDDLASAKLASSEFGTRCIWTQIAVEHGVKRGYFDQEIFVAVSAKLLGFGYRTTTFNQAAAHCAAALSGWNPDKWPFKQVLEQLANDAIDPGSAIGLAATTIGALHRELLLVETRRSVLIRIAEKLASRRQGLNLVNALIAVLPRLFGLNVLGLDEAQGVLKAWLTQALTRPFFRS